MCAYKLDAVSFGQVLLVCTLRVETMALIRVVDAHWHNDAKYRVVLGYAASNHQVGDTQYRCA